MSQVDASQPSATQPAEPKKGTPIRLIVLLAILAVVLTGFLVDLFWMYDQVKAASERLQKAADEIAERPREDGKPQFLSREEVAQAIGFQPTRSEVGEDGKLVEHYRWWGPLPLERRYIVAFYNDKEGKYYNTYRISNRNILGQDEEESTQEQKQAESAQPAPTPVPGTGVMPPSGVTGPPGPAPAPESESAPNDPGTDKRSTEDKDATPDKEATPEGKAEKPVEEPANGDSATKDDSNPDK